MTYEEFLTFIATEYRPTPWRVGQFYFNALNYVRPDLAKEVRATELDPFYDDERIPAFMEALASMWSAGS